MSGRSATCGDAGDEADAEPAEHEQDRVRDPQDRREHEQRRAGGEERQQDEGVMRGDVHDPSMLSGGRWLLRDDHGIDILDDRRAELGEGPAWDERSGDVLWVDITGRAVHAHRLADGAQRTFTLPSPVGAVVPREEAGEGWLALLEHGPALLGEDGTVSGTRHVRGSRRTRSHHGDPRQRREMRPARPLLVRDDGLGPVAPARSPVQARSWCARADPHPR